MPIREQGKNENGLATQNFWDTEIDFSSKGDSVDFFKALKLAGKIFLKARRERRKMTIKEFIGEALQDIQNEEILNQKTLTDGTPTDNTRTAIED